MQVVKIEKIFLEGAEGRLQIKAVFLFTFILAESLKEYTYSLLMYFEVYQVNYNPTCIFINFFSSLEMS